jgi:uncharacterized protein (DUF952 family)
VLVSIPKGDAAGDGGWSITDMIFHITSRTAWTEAQAKGEYIAPSLATEGFIHCSTLSQVLPVANSYYAGQTGLIVLALEPTLLSSALKWEPPSGGTPPLGVSEGEQFPHIYGPINLDAVVKAVELKADSNSAFILPDL